MSRISMLFSFSFGIFSVGFWPDLPSPIWLLLPAIISFLLYIMGRSVLAIFVWGVLYGVCWGHYTLSHQLPEEFNPYELTVKGEVIGLPAIENNRTQFYLEVLAVSPDSFVTNDVITSIEGVSPGVKLKKLRLNWYHPSTIIQPGQVWNLRVKLRRPRGTVNPGGFDYQAWLLRQGVSASGYVRNSNENGLLSTDITLSTLRFNIREDILTLPIVDKVKGYDLKNHDLKSNDVKGDDIKSLIVALTVGDRSMITPKLWENLALSGVVHLMVVSGLHIGFVAYLFYMLGAGLSRLACVWGLLVNARYWGCACSLFASVAYASLAGFSLPTQRALVMVAVAMLALLLDRKISRGLGFGMALSGVAMIDPLAFLSAGFWLSFGAVACLLWLVPVYTKEPVYIKASVLAKQSSGMCQEKDRGENKYLQRVGWIFSLSLFKWHFKSFLYIQWLLFIALSIPLMLFQLPVSWFGPWVNILAIPWVSFAIVPLCLIGTVLLPLSEAWAAEVWTFAGWQLNYFIDLIGLVSDPGNSFIVDLPRFLPLPKSWVVCLALILILALLLLPKGLPGKYLVFPLLLVLFMAPLNKLGNINLPFSKIMPTLSDNTVGSLKVSVLDVGQGLSVVVQTEGVSGKHALVYDTGRGYEDGFNMADAVVIPYLRYGGETGLDMLIVSHGDNDHAGGTKKIVDVLAPKQIVLGEDVSKGRFPFSYCRSGYSWQWDEAFFEFLHPRKKIEKESNNRSCVLQITYREQTIILPGDIESSVERQLQQHKMLFEHQELFERPVTLLIAPHHGSKTSSSKAFVLRLAPKHVVFSAGHKHHFGHPAKPVLDRYRDVGAKVWSTAEHGAVIFTWNNTGLLEVFSERVDAERYWY